MGNLWNLLELILDRIPGRPFLPNVQHSITMLLNQDPGGRENFLRGEKRGKRRGGREGGGRKEGRKERKKGREERGFK